MTDQRLALPASSQLIDYFNAMDDFLDVGPPVYFVASDIDESSRTGQQQACGRFSACRDMSIANILEAERKRPASSFLAEPPAVWIGKPNRYGVRHSLLTRLFAARRLPAVAQPSTRNML